MIWLLAVIALIVAALALQAGLVAYAGYVVLGSYLLSRWLARRWIDDVEAKRCGAAGPYQIGDTVEIALTLRHVGRWPIVWLLVEDFLSPEWLRGPFPRLKLDGRRLRVLHLWPGQVKTLRYRITFLGRGYFPIGPTLLESGDIFGLHRRIRIVGRPDYILVYPKVIPLSRYDFASRRPVGEIRLHDRLMEDPTRLAGVREYQLGDPFNRIHWKATARMARLHSRVYESTTLAGATVLLDFHADGYPSRGEPYRSELAITVAASLAYAVAVSRQPIGFGSNGYDAAARIRLESLPHSDDDGDPLADRAALHQQLDVLPRETRLRPVYIPAQRQFDQWVQVREALARLELNRGLDFAAFVVELAPRLPRDATVIAVLPWVPVETAVALGMLRRLGFAVSVVLVAIPDEQLPEADGRLRAEGIRDVRHIQTEEEVASLGRVTAPTEGPAFFALDVPLA